MCAVGRAGRATRDTAAGDGIEFVAPRTDLFGGFIQVSDDVADEPHAEAFADAPDEHASRWGTALAGLGVASLLAVGIVAAAPWHEDAAPPTTTAPPKTTAPSTTAAVDATAPAPTTPAEDPFAIAAAGGPPVGYLLDPATLDGGTLGIVDRPGASQVEIGRDAWLDVWATPGASSITGNWVAVEVSPWPIGARPGSSVERVRVGGRVGLVAGSRASGLTWLELPVGDGSLELTASGWTTDDLLVLAAGIDLIDHRPVYADGGIAGHELVVSRATRGWGLDGELRSQAESVFAWTDLAGVMVEVATRAADDDADRALRRLLTPPVPGEPFSGVGGLQVVAGTRTVVIGRQLETGQLQATFDERGRSVTVTLWGTDDVATLLDYLDPSVLRAGTGDEWVELGIRLGRQETANESGPSLVEQLVTSGTLTDGTPWTMARSGGSTDEDPVYGITLLGGGDGRTDGVAPDDPALLGPPSYGFARLGLVPSVGVTVGGALAVVVVDAASGAQTLAASSPDGTVATTALTPVPDGAEGVPEGSHLLVGILPFDLVGPWTAELLGSDGQVLGRTSSDGTSTVP